MTLDNQENQRETPTLRFLWGALDLNTELRDILYGGNLVPILLIVVSEIGTLT